MRPRRLRHGVPAVSTLPPDAALAPMDAASSATPVSTIVPPGPTPPPPPPAPAPPAPRPDPAHSEPPQHPAAAAPSRTDLALSGWARAEDALSHTEAQLRAVLETAVDSIITIDGRGTILSVNPATVRLFGYAADEMIGHNVKMLMPSPYQEEHDGYLARYLKTGEKRIIGIGREVQALRKDGTIFPVELAVSEVEPRNLFTGIIRDISDRKLAEARLRETDRLASIGALAAGLGHDMNNVLLPVRAHLNALKATHEAPLNRLEHLARIQTGVSYLQQLADGLHFLAMDPDQVDDGGGVTDLHVWWKQTGALLSKAVPKHVRVTASLPAGLPKVAVAAHALTQAMLNLIVNAGEAIPPPRERKRRQGHVRVLAEAGVDGASVRLAVTDNGVGMTEEVKRRAFDMFFTTKPRGLGTGLGLAIVRKMVDRAGGSIEIDSELGRGTTIALILPVADDGGQQPLAAVSINDGRAASLIRNLLETSGAEVIAGDDRQRADIWMVEPTAENLSHAKAWRAEHPQGGLVLFGRPQRSNAAAWRSLKPVTIDDPDDLDAVRGAIVLALKTP
jgi:PAS domain S-box-containing protein